MSVWDEKIRNTIIRHASGKLIPMLRCHAIVPGPGAGYSGRHQCSHTVRAEYNGVPLCWTHLRQYVNQNERHGGLED